MFPGMQGPQTLPDQEAYPMFWRNLNRFIAITTATVAVAVAVRYCEQRTHLMLVSSL
ncbi:conserved hypothetical protein [Leishmania donovani]|nr:conserved hypothetical protein [Leishmania donovani]